MALAGRVLIAVYPRPDAEVRAVAKKGMVVCLKGGIGIDWQKVDCLAALPVPSKSSFLPLTTR